MQVSTVEVLILVINIMLLFTVFEMNGRIKRLKAKLDQMTKQFDVSAKPNDELNHELRKLLNEGNDVKAVKRVRETLGFSLLEAKQYVDALKSEGK